MPPKRTVSNKGEQNANGAKQLRRSVRLQKNAATAPATGPKEDSKPQKRSKIPQKAKKQPKVKITKEEAAPAQNGETKPDKEQKTESTNDQTD
ncbi:high mobility group nucleosome-binding domain-containing protein 3 isoform X2 [Amblyraja radiata]|uniref:high mobility group nucleosome-binding domain-containing protein 3 isoform X2 n=1 Tax=Amblyraja radiata TaxID=386614 RepID=UPI0014034875|nr:high mobility group nucleosome-binding domain-containing protein 3 isoform X2 [Amblyraja radiata]